MTTRFRASLAIFAIALTALALTATANAAPADFAWSTSVSSTQAGGHPNITMSYSSASAQSLTRLDVDLPQGLMHRNNMTGACSNPLYQSDSCPATSTVGTVSTQLAVAGIPISVPGTIYQLSEPSGGSDATFGIVLRPPLSSLGITSKIYLRDQISFTNGGGLRHSLVGPLNSVTAFGVALPSRIAQLTLTYAGQSNGLPLTNNPTSCRTQTFTATGTFSDGTTRPRSSSYSTTGCQSVPFAPTAELQLDNSLPNQRTNFAILLGGGGGGGAAQLHPGHVVLIGHDFDQIGDFDFKTIDAAPSCTDAQAATTPLSCPAGSKVLDISADIEGFGTVTGRVFKTNSPGHKTVGEITLRQGATVRFTGAIGGDNLSTLTLSGLPQLPFTALRIKSSSPSLWITNTCTIRTAHMIIDSYSGAHAERDASSPRPDCTPAAPTITAGPERGITINTSHVEYRFSSTDSDVTFECKKDDAPYARCASPFVDDWQGEGVHNFEVHAVRGGVAGPAATATFTVDTTGPVVTFEDPADADKDNDGVADQPFRTQDPTFDLAVSDATSGINWDSIDVTFQNTADPKAAPVKGKTRPHVQGHVQVGGAALAPGPTTVTVTVADWIGWVTIVKLAFIVDGSPPSIAIDESGVHYSDGSDVEIPITVSDDSLYYPAGEVTLEVTATRDDGLSIAGKAKVITDRDTGRSKGFGIFEDVPDGSYKVTVRGWDPVKKESIAEGDLVVDRTPPVVALSNTGDADLDGDGLADELFRLPTFEVPFTANDDGSGIDKQSSACGARSVEGGTVKGEISFKEDGTGACALSALPGGQTEVQLRVHNWIGSVTIVKITVVVDTESPSIAIDESGVHVADDGTLSVPYSITDDSLDYPQGDVGTECLRKGWDGTVKGSGKGNKREGNTLTGTCEFTGVSDGTYKVTVRGWDPVKKESVAEIDFTVDRDPPSAQFTDTGDLDSDGDGFADNRYRPSDFSIPFDATDAGSGVDPDASSCTLTARKGGVVKGNITVNSGSLLRCSFTGAPVDDADVEIAVADHRGHVTVLKTAVTVIPPPPVIGISSPVGTYQPGATIPIVFSITGTGPFDATCEIDSSIVITGCTSGRTVSSSSLAPGTHIIRIKVTDFWNRVTRRDQNFSIASSGGGTVCVAIYPPPPGCPGYTPPGGGGVIAFP